MHRFKFYIFFTFYLAICCSFKYDKGNWNLKKNEKGIEVYARKLENSDFKELKSVVYLKTSLSSVVALISDWDSYPKWVYRCGKSTSLKKLSETEVIHYQTVLVPWPAQKRDFVVKIVLSQDAESNIVTIKSICIPNYIPPVEDHIRIKELSATWTLIPLKNGTVQVTYQLLVNPGGSIPAWIVNMASVDGPYETMVNFKQWIIKKKYQDAKFSFIKDAK